MSFLLSENGAAALLGIPERAIATMVRRREIPFVELPTGEIRFDRDDLERWLSTLKRDATRPASGHFDPLHLQTR